MAAPTRLATSSPRRLRTDVEGLRAVAVGLVLLYHGGLTTVAGGYVGVDVFFVVSGYLITTLLLRERTATGTVRLREFYARRLRRLLPAATLVAVATVVAARLVLPPLQVGAVATDGLWAAAWLANLRFVLVGTDYLAAGGPESPLLHYWSLAVEEQFYLLWPLLLVAVGRGARADRRIAWTVGGVLAASLLASVVVTRTAPVVAYFAPHTRAWELAVGAALALVAARGWRVRGRVAALASWVGLGAILLAALVFSAATPFPGWTALLPVLGTAAIILAGEHDDRAGAGAVLRHRPFQAVGKVSYSLYLWHWPVLVLGARVFGGDPSVSERVGLLVLSGALAWATLRLVEDPIRHAGSLHLPVRSVALGGALVATAVAGALVVGATLPDLAGRGAPAVAARPDGATDAADSPRSAADAADGDPAEDGVEDVARLVAASADLDLLPSTLDPALSEAADHHGAIYDDGCFVGWQDTTSPACTYGDPDGERTVVLFGDSHAAHWFPTLDRLADQHRWRLVVLTKPSCPAADVVAVGPGGAPYPECSAWRDDSVARLADERPDVVVVSNARTYSPLDEDLRPLEVDGAAHLARGHDALLERVRTATPDTRLVVLGDTARPGFDVPACLSERLDDIDDCWADPARAVSGRVLDHQRRVADRHGAAFVDPTPWLCTDTVCPVVVGDLLVYSDEDHLTPPFAESLAPVLGPTLLELVDQERA